MRSSFVVGPLFQLQLNSLVLSTTCAKFSLTGHLSGKRELMEKPLNSHTFGTYLLRRGSLKGQGKYVSKRKGYTTDRSVAFSIRGYRSGDKVISVETHQAHPKPRGCRWVRIKPSKASILSWLRAEQEGSLIVEGLRYLGPRKLANFLESPAPLRDDSFSKFLNRVQSNKATGPNPVDVAVQASMNLQEAVKVAWDWLSTGFFPAEFSSKYAISSAHFFPLQLRAQWLSVILEKAS